MTKISCEQILIKFPDLCRELLGPKNQYFVNISSLENIQNESLIYVLQDKLIAQALNSSAHIVLSSVKFKATLPSELRQTWILSPNPELLMALIKNEFLLKTPYRAEQKGIHPTAIIPHSCQISSSARISAYAVLGENVKIGDETFVGSHSTIEAHTKIGSRTTIHPNVYIGHTTIIGDDCEILPQATIASEGFGYAHDAQGQHYRIPHSGRVILQDRVHVGANTAIDRGSIEDTVIGTGTKIDNQCHLAHNSVVGKNSLLTAQFGMAGSSSLGDYFVCGGKTSVTGHIKVTNNVQIAGMSGVTKNIDQPGSYGGFPLQPLQDYLKTKAAIIHLHELRKTVQTFLKGEKK